MMMMMMMTTKEQTTYLIDQIPPLQAQICRNMLVDGPGKLIIKLPGNDAHQYSAKGDDTGHGNQKRMHIAPEMTINLIVIVELADGIADLIVLDGGVDQHGNVERAQSDDLNGVLEAQGIPHQGELKDEAENEEGEIGGDGARFSRLSSRVTEAQLELSKDVSVLGACQR